AAGEDRAQAVFAHVLRGDAADVGLDDLADFLLDGHRGEQFVDLALQLRVRRERPFHLRPVRGNDGAGIRGRFPAGWFARAARERERQGERQRGDAEGKGITQGHGWTPWTVCRFRGEWRWSRR